MHWQYNPFFFPLMVSAAVSAALGVFAWRHRYVAAARSFALLMAAAAWWSLFYALYRSSTELGWKLGLAQALVAGAILVPLAWTLFVLQYTGREAAPTPRQVALLSAVPALTLALALTNEVHHLFWARFELARRGGLVAVDYVNGPGFWLHVAYSWALMSFCVAVLVVRTLRSPHLYRRQAGTILLGALVPWTGNVLHISGMLRFAANPMPFLFTLSGACFAWAIFRFRFLDILPVARERVVDEMRDGVVVLDESGRVLDLNPAARGIFGLTEERMVGRPAAEAIGPLAERIGTGGEASTLQVALPAGGEERSYEVRVSPLTDHGGRRTGRLLVLRDATERLRMEGELWHNAFYDSLTGLANRALFRDRLELAVHRARRSEHPFAVFFLDLNRFKVINDSLGHAVGDELLVTVSRRLEACLRPSDTVARLGGDEFAVLLEEVEGVEDATRVAERMQATISEPIRLQGHDVVASASIGVALGPVPEGDAELLLRNADLAMYRAKESRVLRYAVFDRAMHEQALERLRLESELRRAVERSELRLRYQPIVAAATGRVVSFEALLRWEHPERGLLDPSAFIRIAEETGLIVSIGEWALREGCRQLREWQRRFPAAAPALTVNLSTRELAHPELVSAVERTLQETPPLPRTLHLEITEEAVVESPEALERVLAHLAELGIRFSMDDFGTGYSSLSHLYRLPVDTVKIDRSFIARMGADGEAREIVRTLVSLAHALRMEVVAEGVETEEQRLELCAFGCEYLQGYLVAGPLTVECAEEFLRREQVRAVSEAASAD